MERKFQFTRHTSNEYDIKLDDLVLIYNKSTDELSIIKKYGERAAEKDNFHKNGQIKSVDYTSRTGTAYTDIYKDNKIVLRRKTNQQDWIFDKPLNSSSYINYVEKNISNNTQYFTLYNEDTKLSKIGLDEQKEILFHTRANKKNIEKTVMYSFDGRKLKERVEDKNKDISLEVSYVNSKLTFLVRRKEGKVTNVIAQCGHRKVGLNLCKSSDIVKEHLVKNNIVSQKEIDDYIKDMFQKRDDFIRRNNEYDER